MHRSPRTRFLAASAAVLATLTMAACGGGDDDDDATATTGDTSGAAAATTSDVSDTSDASDTSDDATTTPGSGSAGGEVGEREEYVEAASEEIDWEDESVGTCAAEALVTDDVYGLIQEAGITVDAFREGDLAGQGIELEPEQGQAIADDVAACGDIMSQVEALSGADEAELACLEEHFDNGLVAELIVTSLFSLPPSTELGEASEAMDACVPE